MMANEMLFWFTKAACATRVGLGATIGQSGSHRRRCGRLKPINQQHQKWSGEAWGGVAQCVAVGLGGVVVAQVSAPGWAWNGTQNINNNNGSNISNNM